jgi:DnaD/phage-associated family protein
LRISFAGAPAATHTLIDNSFITEFMPSAPGDYVKAYIYLLYLCAADLELDLDEAARTLSLSEGAFLEALEYWEKRGLLLIDRGEELKVRFVEQEDIVPALSVYEYGELNARLKAIVAPREISRSDLERVYDWIEVFGLEQETVVLLVQHCVQEKGPRVSFNYIHKVAKTWAEEGRIRADAAKEFIQQNTQSAKDTRLILKHLGIFRLPSVDEQDLVRKWREEWGFSLDAIFVACKETTRIQQPNMNYLDKVLFSLYEGGQRSTRQVSEHLTQRDTQGKAIGEVAHALGSRAAITPGIRDMFAQWKQWGFDQQAIVWVAKQSSLLGRHSFKYLDGQLEGYMQKGILSIDQLAQREQQEQVLDADLAVVFQRAGISDRITSAHRDAYQNWMDQDMPFEVILLAAEYSAFAKKPFACLAKILEDWHQKDIHSVSAAKAENDKRKTTAKPKDPAYQQREYDAGEYDALYEKL